MEFTNVRCHFVHQMAEQLYTWLRKAPPSAASAHSPQAKITRSSFKKISCFLFLESSRKEYFEQRYFTFQPRNELPPWCCVQACHLLKNIIHYKSLLIKQRPNLADDVRKRGDIIDPKYLSFSLLTPTPTSNPPSTHTHLKLRTGTLGEGGKEENVVGVMEWNLIPQVQENRATNQKQRGAPYCHPVVCAS